jgi:hypothetical protein
MLKTVIAAAFKSKGVRKISKSELYYTLSFDLKWFTHEKSQQVVDIAIDKALLVEEDAMLKPTFRIEEVEIPFGFKPDLKRIIPSSPLDDIIWEICEKTGKDVSEVTAMINNLQNKLGDLLDAEVVALIIARSYGIDVNPYIDRVWKDVIN